MSARSRLLCLGSTLLACALLASAPNARAGELRAEGSFFRDTKGGVVLLRGVNVTGDAKVPPFMKVSDPAIFDPLQRWGMNVVRLLFTWEAYEPTQGTYDTSYLDAYASAARAAGERGLYVIVDFHQDAFSRSSIGGCGDGFPAWALPPGIPPATPDNGPNCASWGTKMVTDADMKSAWTAFHTDAHGAKTRFLLMLESVSARLAKEPSVIGYDILNEPWGDEATEISALHADAAKAIRKASPGAILFVSPHALISSGNQTKLPAPSFDNFAYSPHFYDAGVILFHSWSGTQPDEPFANMTGKADEWNAPLFLGEFGAPAEATNGDVYVDALYRHLNDHLASGAQWVYTPGWTDATKDGWNQEDFSIVDDKGQTRPNFRLRPYARRIAGTPTRLYVTTPKDPEGGALELEWDHDPSAGETEIFAPNEALSGGPTTAIETTGDTLHCTVATDLITCTSTASGPMRVKVHGAPASPTPAADSPSCGLMGIEALLLWPLAAMARRRRRLPSPAPSNYRSRP